jgi:hypothetical protein
MGDYDVDMDCDMDDAVAFSQEDWTNGETTEDMEWDTAVLEAALHELDHLRHGHGAHEGSSSSLDRGLLDTNDGGLTHADGGIMSMAHDAVHVSIGPRTVTVVPDTNALILEGGASLDRLLERFRAATGADGHVTRARVAVPRKVVHELDGLKSHSGIGGAAGDRRAEVAALARSVNRALERRLRRQQLGQPGSNDDEAELLVQGPADAGRMRVRMRAEGLRDGTGGNGDEEIVYFCQRRVKSGERVVLLTGDVNAAVTARSAGGPDDVPVCALDPREMPGDVVGLFEAARSFYAHAEDSARRLGQADRDVDRVVDEPGPRTGISTVAAHGPGYGPPPPPPPSHTHATPVTVSGEMPTTRVETKVAASGHEEKVVATLAALDLALPPAVEAMLREDLGDMWAAAVRDDAEDILEFTPDDAFEALRKNRMTLTAGRAPRGSGVGSWVQGRESMDAIAAARRRRKGGHGGGFGDRMNALGVVTAACDVLASLPGDIAEVSSAAKLVAKFKAELVG